jgi:hypothetical protein
MLGGSRCVFDVLDAFPHGGPEVLGEDLRCVWLQLEVGDRPAVHAISF